MLPSRTFQLAFLSLAALLVAGGLYYKSASKALTAEDIQRPIDPQTLSGEYIPNETTGQFNGQLVTSTQVAEVLVPKTVLGDTTAAKRIEVDLAEQMLYAYEDDRLVYNFLISSGRNHWTPTGTFKIWGKFRYTKMEGGTKGTSWYYYLPNVPYVMFFSNDEVPAHRGFSIHGTYWHSNFGTPMSHGCINMKTEEAALIYAWANPDIGEAKSGRATEENPGTEVIIYGVAPKK